MGRPPEPVRPALESHLATLVRKELIRPDRPAFAGDDAFRFRHLLIRDAAYESLPEATRAELHERFADWLAQHDLVERDEIVGYHLEQAYRYRAELDPADTALPSLAMRAADHLAAAGRGALDHGDFNAGRSLFRRAAGVLPEGDEQRRALAPDLAGALLESGDDEAWQVLAEAQRSSDPLTRALAAVTESFLTLGGSHSAGFEQREAWREGARVVFEEAGHDYGLALYWWSVAMEAWFRCRAEETARACETALVHLERAGAAGSRLGHPVRGRLIATYAFSPIPVDDAIERVVAVGAGKHGLLAHAWERVAFGRLVAMKGEFGQAREHLEGARQAYLDAGLLMSAGGIAMTEALVEWRAGRPRSRRAAAA